MDSKNLTLRELTEQLTLRDSKLRESEEKFRTIFCTVPTPILIYSNKTGLICNVNNAFLESTGFCEDELLNKDIGMLFILPNLSATIEYLLKEYGCLKNFAATIKKKNGQLLPCLFYTQPIDVNNISIYISIIEVK